MVLPTLLGLCVTPAPACPCGSARHAAVDARERLAGMDSELPGMFTKSEL